MQQLTRATRRQPAPGTAPGELEDPDAASPPAWARTAVAACTALALGLGLLFAGSRSFWHDEAFGVAVGRRSFADQWDLFSHREANMSLYYVLLGAWMKVSESEAFLRSLSALAAAGTVPVVYAIGRRLFGWRTALVASLLFSIHAFVVEFAQEARGYTLVMLLSSVATLLFLRALEATDRASRWWLAYGVVAGVSLYVHFFAGFVVLAHAASLLVRPGPRPVRAALPGAVVLAALAAPIGFFVLTGESNQIEWIDETTPTEVLSTVSALVGRGGPLLLAAMGALMVVGSLPALRQLARRERSDELWRTSVVVLWFALPLVLGVVVSFVQPLFVRRYFIMTVPAAVLLAAAGIVRLPRAWLRMGALVGVTALFVAGTVAWFDRVTKDDWRSAAAFVEEEAAAGDGVVLLPAIDRTPFEYYYRDAGRQAQPVFPRASWGTFDTAVPARVTTAEAAELLAGHDRVWLVAHEDRPPEPGHRSVAEVLDGSFRVAVERTFERDLVIRRYDRVP